MAKITGIGGIFFKLGLRDQIDSLERICFISLRSRRP